MSTNVLIKVQLKNDVIFCSNGPLDYVCLGPRPTLIGEPIDEALVTRPSASRVRLSDRDGASWTITPLFNGNLAIEGQTHSTDEDSWTITSRNRNGLNGSISIVSSVFDPLLLIFPFNNGVIVHDSPSLSLSLTRE